MYGKHKGFTLIEILVVVTIIGVLAGLVVVLIPKSQFEQRKLGCINNCRNLAGMLEARGTEAGKYPILSGPNLLLYFVVKREIDHKSTDRLGILFCPGDASESLEQAGGLSAYEKLDLNKTGQYGDLTSYAANDQKNGSCAAKPGGREKVLLCDDDEEHHDGKGFVVGLTGGTAKWWDKYDKWKVAIETKMEVGEGSEQEEFQCLRAE